MQIVEKTFIWIPADEKNHLIVDMRYEKLKEVS